MSCRAVTLVALAVSLVVPLPSLAASPPVAVTTCGQVVTGSHAVLAADLDCPTDVGSIAVQLRSGARLDLQGHTITGGYVAVACGTLLCGDTYCVATKKSGSCRVSNGTITGAKYAIAARQIVVRDMTFVNNGNYHVLAVHKADVYGSHFESAAPYDNVVQGDKRVRLFDTTVNGGNISGAKRVELHATTVTNAGTIGVSSPVIRLFGSSVTGSLDHPTCGILTECADLLSSTRPLVDATSTCERSQRTRSGSEPIETWGVCTLD